MARDSGFRGEDLGFRVRAFVGRDSGFRIDFSHLRLRAAL